MPATYPYAYDATLPPLIPLRPLYQLWANVQTPGLHHKAHYHAGVTVAGTYYVAVPRRAGALHLQDPRGRLDPFSRDIIHRPSPGDLLLWPPWLIHR